MIEDYVPASYHTQTVYELVFDDGENNGFAFPCDCDGELIQPLPWEAMANYNWCLQHKENFVRFNEVVEYTYSIKDNAHGICHCGNAVELYDQYYGACQCNKCGQWYNLFGQSLVPPEYWEDGDPSEVEYDCY